MERCGHSREQDVLTCAGYSRVLQGYSRGTLQKVGGGRVTPVRVGRRRGGGAAAGHRAAFTGELDLEELKEALKDLGCARSSGRAGGWERRV